MRRRYLALLLALCLALISLATAPSLRTQAQEGSGNNQVVHTVQPGENLFRIALKYKVSVASIQQVNRITNANLIFAGQVLIIPNGTVPPPTTVTPPPPPTVPPTTVTPPPPTGGTTYTVQRGDTLAKIARQFNTTVAAIAQANGIVNTNLIFVGQVLKITAGAGGGTVVTPPPGGGTVTPPTGGGPFEAGGQVLELNANTQAVMRSAKLVYAKFQIQSGDPAAIGIIQNAKNNGFKVLISLVGDKAQILNAGYQDAYANYAGELARNGADAIEIWNEQNLDREWPQGQINPQNYVPLLRKAYAVIKQNNANTLVISGAPAPTGAEGAFGLDRVWNDDRYYAGMAAAGAANFADCIGVHYNEGVIAPTATTGDPRRDNYPTRYLPSMLNRALASFPGKQACFTEIGYLSPEGYGPLPSGFAWAAGVTAQQQAQYIGDAARFLLAGGRTRLFIVFNVDFTRYDEQDPQAGYAILRPGNICIACATLSVALP
jgi:LysM repeat protein